MRFWPLVVLAAVSWGCSSEETTSAPPGPSGCGDLELALPDGGCWRPAVPPEALAAGQ